MATIDDAVVEPEPPSLKRIVKSWVAPHPDGFLAARYLFLRALGLVFLSVFVSYAYQIQGLIGPHGILPAADYLRAAGDQLAAPARYVLVPTIFWITTTDRLALQWVVATGLVASILLTLNVLPRLTVGLCTALFLSIISVSSVFASYQSDGMLLEAGFLALFFAPGGLRPGFGESSPPSRMARFMLVWEWFRIYFESGVVKLASGDPEWRNLHALDHYYENGPLPTWIGWYTQHLPQAFHAFTAAGILFVELVLVWAAFLPRPFRLWLFFIVSLLQVGIILTANYAFLNYLVLALGVLLIDDRSTRYGLSGIRAALARARRRWMPLFVSLRAQRNQACRRMQACLRRLSLTLAHPQRAAPKGVKRYVSLAVLLIAFDATLLNAPLMSPREMPLLLSWPALVFEPFRFANGYGLFAVMTRQRYEIEFQGSLDGKMFAPYPFRYKPQNPTMAPGIYAPYQPRFEWNLWFASLGRIEHHRWVLRAAAGLLRAEPDVLALFAFDPFQGKQPAAVRTVIYQYWFSTMAERRSLGSYWRRARLGEYAPTLSKSPDGSIRVGPKTAL